MIVCKDFVFLHLHKSGGTFVNQLMLNCMPSAKPVGYHFPYTELPPEFRKLPVLGTVRNPWSYYVSWYHFQARQERPNALFLIASDDRELDFKGTIENLASLEADEDRINRLAAVLPDHFVSRGLNLTKSCITKIRGSGAGFYSFLYSRLYSGVAAPHIVQMEKLRAGLAQYMRANSTDSLDRISHFLATAPKLNVTPHNDYRTYYTSDLRDLILRKDAALISKHAYEF